MTFLIASIGSMYYQYLQDRHESIRVVYSRPREKSIKGSFDPFGFDENNSLEGIMGSVPISRAMRPGEG